MRALIDDGNVRVKADPFNRQSVVITVKMGERTLQRE